ncbi:hypothetical protein J2W32_004457 [Variovorax boronicumulans]|uniref:Uncharacterized protein n=1 Tax=Variovorax boronicumulans TaxID=436515 RepID=A0AAW8CY20_9BURK|nr:hypothetical protein [Variovorax boronicumulans]MDP9895359.1 hypothetical protein [Variovorax boronicumulans]MDQ0055399.1 hypothetical protein [Variovorax boronicumulans]
MATTMCLLNGLTAQDAIAAQQIVAGVPGITGCSISKTSRNDFFLFAEFDSARSPASIHSSIQSAFGLANLSIVVEPALQVAPITLS